LHGRNFCTGFAGRKTGNSHPIRRPPPGHQLRSPGGALGLALRTVRSAHAEQNAINFAARYGISIEGATLYTTHYPCSWCAKSIVNAGIARVIYDVDYPDPLAKEILSSIQVRRIKESQVEG